MSGPGPAAELLAHPAADVPAVAVECKARILEREGIAMFVALHDARPGRELEVRDPLGAAEGARLAELFDHYERGLAAAPPEGSGEPQGGAPVDREVEPHGWLPPEAAALIDVLVVLSDQHLRARPEPSP
jgi:hypothetical protein